MSFSFETLRDAPFSFPYDGLGTRMDAGKSGFVKNSARARLGSGESPQTKEQTIEQL